MSILLALAAATTAIPQPQAVIPFIGSDGIVDRKADGTRGLWLRAVNGKWYYLEFLNGRCPRLNDVAGLRFIASPIDQLDNNSTVVVEGTRCPIRSLVLSEGPPSKRKNRPKG